MSELPTPAKPNSVYYTSLKDFFEQSGLSRAQLKAGGIEIHPAQLQQFLEECRNKLSSMYLLRTYINRFGCYAMEAPELRCGWLPSYNYHEGESIQMHCINPTTVNMPCVEKIVLYLSECDWIDMHVHINDHCETSHFDRNSPKWALETHDTQTLISFCLVPSKRDAIEEYWKDNKIPAV